MRPIPGYEMGKQAIKAFDSGDRNKAFSLYSEMKANSMELVGMLDKLLESTSVGVSPPGPSAFQQPSCACSGRRSVRGRSVRKRPGSAARFLPSARPALGLPGLQASPEAS